MGTILVHAADCIAQHWKWGFPNSQVPQTLQPCTEILVIQHSRRSEEWPDEQFNTNTRWCPSCVAKLMNITPMSLWFMVDLYLLWFVNQQTYRPLCRPLLPTFLFSHRPTGIGGEVWLPPCYASHQAAPPSQKTGTKCSGFVLKSEEGISQKKYGSTGTSNIIINTTLNNGMEYKIWIFTILLLGLKYNNWL